MKKYSYSFNAYFDILPGRMPGRQKKDEGRICICWKYSTEKEEK